MDDMRSDDIRERLDTIRDRAALGKGGPLTREQELAMMEIEALLELNTTLVFIKENTRTISEEMR